jgi:hypothetical protein
MTAPTTPQPTATAQWNGTQWVDYNPTTQQWYVATAPVQPAPAATPNDAAAATGTTEPIPRGTFKQFFQQRQASSSGPTWKFKDRPPGTSYWGIVARELTEHDIMPQTDPEAQGGAPRKQRDGTVKYQMVVPIKMIPNPTSHPDGMASLPVKGDLYVKLNAAMAAAGSPEHPDGGYVPEAGAFIQVTKTGERPIPGLNPAYIYEVIYRRPEEQWSVQKAAEVDAAHKRLAEAPPAPKTPIAGDPPEVWMAYTKWLAEQQAATQPANGTTPVAPATAAASPPTAAAPPIAAPVVATAPATAPPAVVPPPSNSPAGVQAAAAHVVSADANGQPAPTVPPNEQPLAVPPPSTAPPVAASPPPSAPPAASTGAASGSGIPYATWAAADPEQRKALMAISGQQCPADLPVAP